MEIHGNRSIQSQYWKPRLGHGGVLEWFCHAFSVCITIGIAGHHLGNGQKPHPYLHPPAQILSTIVVGVIVIIVEIIDVVAAICCRHRHRHRHHHHHHLQKQQQHWKDQHHHHHETRPITVSPHKCPAATRARLCCLCHCNFCIEASVIKTQWALLPAHSIMWKQYPLAGATKKIMTKLNDEWMNVHINMCTCVLQRIAYVKTYVGERHIHVQWKMSDCPYGT